MIVETANFGFLKQHDAQLVRLGALAERYFRDDPNTCLLKVRQFGELLAQQVAARTGTFTATDEPQADLLRRLKADRVIPREVAELFHQVRIAGNQAAHDHSGTHAEALTSLKVARQLGIWFHRTFAKDLAFKPGPFVPPPDPAAAAAQLHEELARLRAALAESQSTAERARAEAEAQGRARESAEERVRREAEDRILWEQLAQEAEEAKLALTAQLAALQAAAAQVPAQQKAATLREAEEAAKAIHLDEAATRTIIDRQLRERGWEADSESLRFGKGVRPAKGRAMAIAEWPTASGPADYALFIGTQLIAVVEAKRRNKNVSAAIDQAERYAKDFRFDGGAEAIGGPWGEYRAPFVFSANGRPYLKQIETESGIWFRDTRRDTNRRRALVDWFTPDGLKAELETDRVSAQEALKSQPFVFGFPLRPYQRTAIERVEEALAADRREMLVAMATGTGKTKLAIALLYRLLNVKRFRRVCFVVDRNALGEQTRSFMYIDDCIRDTLALMTSDFCDPMNLGSSELVSVNQLLDIIEEIAGVRLRRRHDPGAPQGVRGRNSDNRLIRRVLGWEPGVRLRDGLGKTYAWIYDELTQGRTDSLYTRDRRDRVRLHTAAAGSADGVEVSYAAAVASSNWPVPR
jgi:type I restriction enzyme R subunit